MTIISMLFWSLVLITVVVSFRWGSMIGLIFFVAALMIGVVAVSHFAGTGGHLSASGRGPETAPYGEALMGRGGGLGALLRSP